MLTLPDLSVYSSRISGKDVQSKPDLQFEYSDKSRLCRGYQQLRRRKRRFLLGANISNRYLLHSIASGGKILPLTIDRFDLKGYCPAHHFFKRAHHPGLCWLSVSSFIC